MDLTSSPSELGREDFLVIDLERFQGPLDLLLHLIRQQDLDIFQIPIARITHQFLAAIEGIEAKDLDNAGEFLEMAASLIRIKARMLLPGRADEDTEDPRAELVRRLLEFEQIRDISLRLATSEADRARRFGKGFFEPRIRGAIKETPLKTTWQEVVLAALAITPPDHADRAPPATRRTVAVEEKMSLILETLGRVRRIEFSRLVRPFKNRMHGVVTFLAGLELTRQRRVRLRQTSPFGELWVCRGMARAEAPEGTAQVPADERWEGGL